MTVQDIKAFILPRLLSGVRDGMPLERIGASTSLQALSLTGQAMRFDRPARPAQFLVEEGVEDGRRIIPDASRKLLIRLMTGKGPTSNMLAAAIARAMDVRSLRPHPFDLPKLEAFVKSHAEALGAEAMAFSQREAPAEQKQSYFAPDKLTDETWMLGTPAAKVSYVGARRAADPAAALALLEATWGVESADNRLRLLGTLRAELSDADAPFLTGLAKDRAPRVRELAQRLLARLPGAAGEDPALKAILERIGVGKSGLVFKKATISLELPATVQKPLAAAWVRENFSGISLIELAKALSIYPDDLVEAAHKDAFMTFACFVMATEDKRFDVTETIVVRHMGDVWDAIVASGMEELPGYSVEEKARWAEIAVQPRMWTADTPLWSLTRLVQLLDGPATATLMQRILGSKPWLALLKDPTRLVAEVVDALAVLCPSAMRPALRLQLAGIDPAKTNSANLFLDLIDTLEATHA